MLRVTSREGKRRQILRATLTLESLSDKLLFDAVHDIKRVMQAQLIGLLAHTVLQKLTY